MNWHVQSISATEIAVLPENHSSIDVNIHATVHVSGAIDSCDGCDDLEANLDKSKKLKTRVGIHKLHPFGEVRVGQKLQARIVQLRHDDDNSEEAANGDKEQSKRIVVMLALLPSTGSNAGK